MRTITLSLLLLAACASGPRPVNVANVRGQIATTINQGPADRTVTSMGRTSWERAVVYTRNAQGVRQEETWVKQGNGWRLEGAVAVSAN